MALTYDHETIHYVECDGCRSRAPFGFRRFVAIFKARRAGFRRHELQGANNPEAWLCSSCQVEYDESNSVEKTPLQIVATRS